MGEKKLTTLLGLLVSSCSSELDVTPSAGHSHRRARGPGRHQHEAGVILPNLLHPSPLRMPPVLLVRG